MKFRNARAQDAPLLAQLNQQLIRDEGHANAATVSELTERMRQWLATNYSGIIFEDERGVIAYALYQDEPTQVYLRQFFVARDRRRAGLGRQAMTILFTQIWPKDKRLTVSVLFHNEPAVAFWKAVGYREYSMTLEIQAKTNRIV
ncbi:MAG: GCN5-related N-acetyltransferase [Pedosphaera sp.]|nr:GCN5-related N-acetyltransferase [Pedosphaera sp.]